VSTKVPRAAGGMGNLHRRRGAINLAATTRRRAARERPALRYSTAVAASCCMRFVLASCCDRSRLDRRECSHCAGRQSLSGRRGTSWADSWRSRGQRRAWSPSSMPEGAGARPDRWSRATQRLRGELRRRGARGARRGGVDVSGIRLGALSGYVRPGPSSLGASHSGRDGLISRPRAREPGCLSHSSCQDT